jgi:hypothetical protein
MDLHQTAMTAAFLMHGLHRADLGEAIIAYAEHGGMLELVDAAMDWVHPIQSLRNAADSLELDYPGVWDYEVSEEFGAWLGGSIIDDRDLPERTHAWAILIDLVESFFRLNEPESSDLRRQLRARLERVAVEIMTQQDKAEQT